MEVFRYDELKFMKYSIVINHELQISSDKQMIDSEEKLVPSVSENRHHE